MSRKMWCWIHLSTVTEDYKGEERGTLLPFLLQINFFITNKKGKILPFFLHKRNFFYSFFVWDLEVGWV